MSFAASPQPTWSCDYFVECCTPFRVVPYATWAASPASYGAGIIDFDICCAAGGPPSKFNVAYITSDDLDTTSFFGSCTDYASGTAANSLSPFDLELTRPLSATQMCGVFTANVKFHCYPA